MSRLAVSFNTELPAPAGAAPEWIQLLPAGPLIQGRDGRSWTFDPAAMSAVLERFARRGAPMVVDWEHASEIRAPKGEESPASGWLTALEDRGGELWGRVEWTPRAAGQIADREYRFVSPAFYHHKDTGRIEALSSVGLTNSPNLRLAALNRAGSDEEDHMKTLLLKGLGLSEDATAEQALASLNSLKAKAATSLAGAGLTPDLCRALGLAETADAGQALVAVNGLKAHALDLTRYVPRADYDQAVNRAQTAEGLLKEREKAGAEAEITALVDQAVKDGKVAPASKGFYLAVCRKEGGVEEFKTFLASAPVIAEDAALKRETDAAGAPRLSDAELTVCRSLGLSPEDYAKNLEVN